MSLRDDSKLISCHPEYRTVLKSIAYQIACIAEQLVSCLMSLCFIDMLEIAYTTEYNGIFYILPVFDLP